jgi:hypothetical protein
VAALRRSLGAVDVAFRLLRDTRTGLRANKPSAKRCVSTITVTLAPVDVLDFLRVDARPSLDGRDDATSVPSARSSWKPSSVKQSAITINAR